MIAKQKSRRPMSRQEAGRRGAEVRWSRERGRHRPMSREEAGRRGAEARWGKSYHNSHR